MARIEVDGVEVITDDDEPQPNVPAWRKRRFRRGGMNPRQHVEQGAKKVLTKIWDYVTGEGDDFDRLLKMAGKDDDKRGR